MVYSTLFLASLVAVAHATATNDWSKPCLNGVCSYDLPASAGSSSGTLKIWGSKDAISDITTAAGWEILGCAPDALSQDIRLVCRGGDSQSAGCAHLYGAAGAEGKIVRLPESCGKSAFARVARAWVPKDQSIPASIAKRIARRDGRRPQVRALTVDTNFAAVDSTKTGIVNFAVKGANVPGAAGDIDTSTIAPQRRSRIYHRGLFDFVGDAINSIQELNDFNVDESTTLPPLDVDKKFNLLNQDLACPPNNASINIDVDAKAHAVATIGVAASGTIVPPKIDDFSVITSLTADINGSVDLTASVAGTLDSGKIKIFEIGVPGLDFPGILTLGPTFEVNAQAIASLDLDIDLTVGINYHIEKAELIFPAGSKKAKDAGGAFNIGDTPLKLSVSPSVKATGIVEAHLIPSINLKVSALGDIVEAGIFLELDASANMKLSLEAQAEGSLTVDKAKRTMPEGASIAAEAAPAPDYSSPASSMHNTPAPPLHPAPASPMPSAPAPAMHDSPSPAPGNAMHGAPAPPKQSSSMPQHDMTAQSMTHKAADTMNSANSANSKTMTTVSMHHNTPTSMVTKMSKSTASTDRMGSSATISTSAAAQATGVDTGIVATKDINGSFGGCIEIGAGLDVNAGADANFFGLFDQNTKIPLFSKEFQIFKKCFGNNARRSFPRFSRRENLRMFVKRELECPLSDVGAAVSVVDEVVSAVSIVAA